MTEETETEEAEAFFFEVEHPFGGGVVLGKMSLDNAMGLGQHYADRWQGRSRLIRVPFEHVMDHHPHIPGSVTEVATFEPRPVPEPENEILSKEEEDLEWAAMREQQEKEDMHYSIGRIIIARAKEFAELNKLDKEKSAEGDIFGIIDVFRWLEEGLTADELKLFHSEAGVELSEQVADLDQIDDVPF